MGNNFGPANDSAQQLAIMRSAFELIYSVDKGGVLVDYDYEWPEPFEYFTGQKKKAAAS